MADNNQNDSNNDQDNTPAIPMSGSTPAEEDTSETPSSMNDQTNQYINQGDQGDQSNQDQTTLPNPGVQSNPQGSTPHDLVKSINQFGLRTAGNDPQSLMKHLAGDRAMDPNTVSAIGYAVDKNGSLPPTQKKMQAVQYAYQRALQQRNDPTLASEAALGVLQHYRKTFDMWRTGAAVKMDQGDIGGAIAAANKAFQGPFGDSVHFATVVPSYEEGGLVRGFEPGGTIDNQDLENVGSFNTNPVNTQGADLENSGNYGAIPTRPGTIQAGISNIQPTPEEQGKYTSNGPTITATVTDPQGNQKGVTTWSPENFGTLLKSNGKFDDLVHQGNWGVLSTRADNTQPAQPVQTTQPIGPQRDTTVADLVHGQQNNSVEAQATQLFPWASQGAQRTNYIIQQRRENAKLDTERYKSEQGVYGKQQVAQQQAQARVGAAEIYAGARKYQADQKLSEVAAQDRTKVLIALQQIQQKREAAGQQREAQIIGDIIKNPQGNDLDYYNGVFNKYGSSLQNVLQGAIGQSAPQVQTQQAPTSVATQTPVPGAAQAKGPEDVTWMWPGQPGQGQPYKVPRQK